MRVLLLILPLAVAMASCASTKKVEVTEDMPPVAIKCKNGVEATLTKLVLDGCNWVLVLPTGEKLEPMNITEFLAEADDENGKELNVRVEYYETKSASICMVGKTVAISCFEVIR